MITSSWTARVAALGAATALMLLLVIPAASASCHIAAFEESDVTVDASAGSVTLTVFLQGRQPGCEGSVGFETADGTAAAGTDYVATNGTLNFVADDDREEDVTIEILPGATDGTQFQVVLSGGEGGVSASGTPATITIQGGGDDGGAATTASTTDDDSAASEAATTGEDADAADGGNTGLVIGVVVLVVAVLGGGAMAMRKRA